MTRLRQEPGFTLVELLVVIFILALLAAITYSAMGPAREKGRQTVCVSNLRQIGQLIQMYRQDYGGGADEGRYFEMALPPDSTILMRHFGWKGKWPEIPDVWRCPDVLRTPDFKGMWGYSYQVCDDLHARQGVPVQQCSFVIPVQGGSLPVYAPDFATRVKKRGGEYPLVFDPWHNANPHSPPPTPRYVIVLRLGGHITRGTVAGGSSYEW